MIKIIIYPMVFFAVMICTSSCKQRLKKETRPAEPEMMTLFNPPGYDFSQLDVRIMKKKLKEISGIHYIKADLFVAIEDEDGKIFTVDFKTGEILTELAFKGHGDFEDITMDGDNYYVLESNGRIYKIPLDGDLSGMKKYTLPDNKNKEFESIYLDSTGENLVLICKDCFGNKKGAAIDAYRFNLKSEVFSDLPAFTINAARLLNGHGQNQNPFKPSGAAIHPIEKKLYVVCSDGNLLLVCNLQGDIENSFRLNPSSFKQPEGIAFSPNGDLYISNEAGNGKANIIKIVYNSNESHTLSR